MHEEDKTDPTFILVIGVALALYAMATTNRITPVGAWDPAVIVAGLKPMAISIAVYLLVRRKIT